MPKRQDPPDPTGLPYDLRIDRANVQRSEADVVQAQNVDRTLMVDRAGTFYRTAVFSKTFNIVESITGTETMEELEASPIVDPAVTDNLTVAMGLNKLASNLATARNMAGVHYREDGGQGVLLGEQVAIQYLRDIAATYNETFSGYEIRRFDGTLEPGFRQALELA